MTLEPTDAVAHTQSIVAEMDRRAARIAELEAENARLHQIIESASVPSPVIRIAPLPAPTEAVVATPLVRRRNQARCLVCGDVIESKHRHDYVSCRCGAIAVDGGADYERRIGYVGFFDPKFVATPLAPPVNKIATYPRNSPANGVDEQ